LGRTGGQDVVAEQRAMRVPTSAATGRCWLWPGMSTSGWPWWSSA